MKRLILAIALMRLAGSAMAMDADRTVDSDPCARLCGRVFSATVAWVSASDPSEVERRKLYWALRTRVLTDAEMTEVARQGDMLNIELNVSFSREEKARELNDALLQQFRLRAVAKQAECVMTQQFGNRKRLPS